MSKKFIETLKGYKILDDFMNKIQSIKKTGYILYDNKQTPIDINKVSNITDWIKIISKEWMFFWLDKNRKTIEVKNSVIVEKKSEPKVEEKKSVELNELVDVRFWHKITFKRIQWTSSDFTITLKLKSWESRKIWILTVPSGWASPVLRVERKYAIHYMYKMGWYWFNYKLLDYIENERFKWKNAIIRLEEIDTGKKFKITVSDILKNKKNNVLNFDVQWFELQIFYPYEDMKVLK